MLNWIPTTTCAAISRFEICLPLLLLNGLSEQAYLQDTVENEFEQTLKWFDILATLKLSSTYSDLESNDTQPVVDCTEPNVRMRNNCKQSCSLATELDLEYHA